MHLIGSKEADQEQIQEVMGKKALNLHLLIKAGFAVPPGFVVTHQSPWKDDGKLSSFIEKIGGFPVAVRSSGQMEDLEGASFAGLYETFLEVGDLPTLKERIGHCFDSASSPRIRDYLLKKKISMGAEEVKKRLSVLVQRMVPAACAGVAFTINPLTGVEDHLLLEACHGLGEKLVSGMVTPDQYIISYGDGKVVTYQQGSEKVILSDRTIRDISREALSIQAYFRRPQDIEWAVDGKGELWILQSRPITKIQWRKDLGEFTNADLKDGGVSARVCTPLMYSLYKKSMVASMPAYLAKIALLKSGEDRGEEWMVSCYGRVYWNAGLVKKCLFRVPGFHEETFDRDIGIQKEYGKRGARTTPVNAETIAGAIPILIALTKEYGEALEATQTFLQGFEVRNSAWMRLGGHLKELTDAEFFYEFGRLINEFFLDTETSYYRTIYNNSNYQTDFKSHVKKLDAKTGGSTNLLALMSGLADMAHMEVQKGICRLYRVAVEGKDRGGTESPAWREELQAFLKLHYHHGDAELELKTPRWGEVPERVAEMVRQMVSRGAPPTDPVVSEKNQEAIFRQEMAKIRERLGRTSLWPFGVLAYHKLAKMVATLRTFLTLREAMRECSTKSYYMVRLFVLEMGRRLSAQKKLGAAPDIFLFHVDELLQVAETREFTPALREAADLRRQFYDGYSAFEAPNEFGSGVLQRDESSYLVTVNGKEIMKGIPCSGGVVEGTAKVIKDLDQVGLIAPGDILVTKFTDPGWTPVLGLVAGIVTEVGGVLSHAAVIGREYGIPAVLNIPGVTQWIKSGQTIRVDGDTGAVEIIK